MSGRLAIDFGTSNTVLAVWSEDQQTGITHHIPDYGQLYTQGNEKVSLIPSLKLLTPTILTTNILESFVK